MEEELIEIKRKDGIVYRRKRKEAKYDGKLSINIDSELKNDLKEIAENENLGFHKMVRDILREFVKKYK